MTDLLQEQLAHITNSPYGVKKIRALILQLAILGRLVRRNSSEGRAFVEDSTVDIAVPFKISESWSWARLGDVAQLRMGKTPSTKDEKFWSNEGIPWVSIADMTHYGTVTATSRTVTSVAKKQVFRCEPVPKGTLLMSFKLTIGKVSILGVDGYHNEAIVSVLPEPKVSKDYLFRFLPEFANMGMKKDAIKGATLNSESLSNIPVAVPPLAEQHRIVAKVDELMALCDRLEAQQSDAESAHKQLVKALLHALTQSTEQADFASSWERIKENFDTLFCTEASVDELKQALLQLAVMGKLVPQDPRDEPAGELIQRIGLEKDAAHKRAGAKPHKPLIARFAAPETFKIPDSWSWTRLRQLISKTESGWSPTCENIARQGTNWGVLKVSAVSWGQYLPEKNKALPSNLAARPDCEVKKGDFLISRANTSELVARSVIVKESPPKLMMSDKIVRIVFTQNVDLHYINNYNATDFARGYFAAVAGGTSSSMKNVSRDQILDLDVPLPPLNEQHRIVAKVDELMALCDQLKNSLQEASKLQESFATTVVEDAVSGSSNSITLPRADRILVSP